MVTAENQELESEHQKKVKKVSKPSRTRREKAIQNEVLKATSVKRAYQGAVPAVATEECALSVPENTGSSGR